jgi:preprotein translocase subunit SecD
MGAASCGTDSPAIPSAELTVRVEKSSIPSDVTKAEKIITLRLKNFLPDSSSSLTSSMTGDSIRFQFYGPAPDEQIAKSLATTQGTLRLSLANLPSDVWITDADVEDANLLKVEGGAILRLQLSESAARRLRALTMKNVGRQLRVSWDGKTLLQAAIRQPLSSRIDISAPAPPEGLVMRAILLHGRLPVWVADAQFRSLP